MAAEARGAEHCCGPWPPRARRGSLVGAEFAASAAEHQGAAQVHGERQQLQLQRVPDERAVARTRR